MVSHNAVKAAVEGKGVINGGYLVFGLLGHS